MKHQCPIVNGRDSVEAVEAAVTTPRRVHKDASPVGVPTHSAALLTPGRRSEIARRRPALWEFLRTLLPYSRRAGVQKLPAGGQ